MRFPVTLYQNENGTYIATCATVPGTQGEGDTEEDALHSIRENIKHLLHERHEKKLMLMVETREIEVSLNI